MAWLDLLKLLRHKNMANLEDQCRAHVLRDFIAHLKLYLHKEIMTTVPIYGAWDAFSMKFTKNSMIPQECHIYFFKGTVASPYLRMKKMEKKKRMVRNLLSAKMIKSWKFYQNSRTKISITKERLLFH